MNGPTFSPNPHKQGKGRHQHHHAGTIKEGSMAGFSPGPFLILNFILQRVDAGTGKEDSI